MRKLNVIYILPSRYDDEGYVIRFFRGILPSNTLAVLKSLTLAIARSKALGDDVEITVDSYDDTVQRAPLEAIIRRSRRGTARVLVGFVGVQSNQFPRASDLALQLRAAGVPVMIGGFHVSGMLAMFKKPSPEMQALLDAGVTLVKGEVEAPGVLEGLLRDGLTGALKPLYEIAEAPQLRDARVPQPDDEYLKRFFYKNMGTIDTSRGCTFNCSFCTIINVQGRSMRHRSAEAVLQTIEENHARGVNFYFFTDDNLARNPVWEQLFDGLIALREKGVSISFMMQVDTAAYKLPRFIDKASLAGCYLVFIGMETINPSNIEATGKKQNKVGTFATMVELWHKANVVVHVGYIIGLPHDTRESVREDVERLRDDVKVDVASFFMLTPLPGSRDHRNMVEQRVPIDADLNNLDSFHETFRHGHLAPGQWYEAYNEAWEAMYSKDTIVNVLLRTPRSRYWQMLAMLIWYRYCTLAHTHPMVTGMIRLKERVARRAAFPRESVSRYAWRRIKDVAWDLKAYARIFCEFQEIWMLTRPTEDPRWAAVAELHAKWTDARQRLRQIEVQDHCEAAMAEIRAMLQSTADKFRQLGSGSADVSLRLQRSLLSKAQEVEAYLGSFELQKPTWRHVVKAEAYISEGLLAGYEELAIRYVAKRRRFNRYRREVLQRLKTGRILGIDVMRLPVAALVELALGLRFGFACIVRPH